MKISIYGASDDLIEIDGDISFETSEHSDDETKTLSFSDGTKVSIKYGDEGVWNVDLVKQGDKLQKAIKHYGAPDELTMLHAVKAPAYSDQVDLEFDGTVEFMGIK